MAEEDAKVNTGAEGDDVVVEDTPGYKKPAPRALSEVSFAQSNKVVGRSCVRWGLNLDLVMLDDSAARCCCGAVIVMKR